MKILFISHKHPPSMGGMETQNFHLVNELNKNNIVLKLIIQPGQSRVNFFATLSKRLRTILKNNKDLDIIHLNDGLMAFFLHWLPEYTSIPIAITFHGLDLIFPSKFYQKRLRKFLRPHCYFIAVSQFTKIKGIEFGIEKSKIQWIDNGVDHNFGTDQEIKPKATLLAKHTISYDEDSIFLISIGRAVPRKGISWFIDNVMPELDKNVHYIIIGPNNVKGFTRLLLSILPKSWSRFLSTLMGYTTDYHLALRKSKNHNLQNRVHFLGGVPFNELVSAIKASDLMIMPNVRFEGDMEGFGLVILEANICEKYVLGSELEGITSAIHNDKNGTLIQSGNSKDWIEKIRLETKSRDQLKQKGRKAREYVVEKFSWKKMARSYEAFFQEIVEKSQ